MQLNKKQQEMINVSFPLLTIAGPGSGKTHTLISKIMKENKTTNLENMLIITFTNKAGNEIKERLSQVTKLSNDVSIGTFHSIFLQNILKVKEFEKFKLILPKQEELMFRNIMLNYYNLDMLNIKKSMKYLNDKLKKEFGKKFKDIITTLRRSIYECHYKEDHIVHYVYNQFDKDISLCCRELLLHKEVEQLFSFDDILRYTLMLLEQGHSFKQDLINKYQQIYIDEFQDTNKLQFAILKHLNKNNVCAIGDPYQSIYSFLEARIENVFDFNSKFQPTLVQLNKNYRSLQNIVHLTNEITNYFENKLNHKNINLEPLISYSDDSGDKIDIVSTKNKENTVLNEINKLRKNYNLKDIAVIIRNNKDSSQLEKLLLQNKIPYKKLSGISFFELREIQIMIHTLQFWENKKNYNSFREIAIYYENLGEESIEELINLARLEDAELTVDFVEEHVEQLHMKRKKSLMNFLNFFELYNTYNIDNYKMIINETKMIEELKSELGSIDADESVNENVEQFYSDIDNLFQKYQDISLINRELQISLLGQDNVRKKTLDDVLTITTAHSAKGLEWKCVILMHTSKNNFTESFYDQFQVTDEQIRLLYVAVSRAKEKLILIHQEKDQFGKIKPLDVIINDILRQKPNLFNVKKSLI